MTQQSPFRKHWQLHPDVVFLNHGSFGAAPTVVLDKQRELRDELEREPIKFLAPERELEPKLDRVREVIARLVGANVNDLAWVRNATDAVNAVLRSFPFSTGDEIVFTNHGYNACNNAARFAAERSGAQVRVAEVPFPISHPDQVVQAIDDVLTDRTRLLLVDHVTSATGLVLPLQRIISLARSRGVRVMVDGAHGEGMLPLNLAELDADYYTSNHHKWLCGPKASGFLWVREAWQDEVRPNVISHAANRSRPNRSKFIAEFDWVGTYDPTPILTMPAAIEFLDGLLPGGIEKLMIANRELALQARKLLCDAFAIEPPAPSEMIGSLVTLPLPPGGDTPEGGVDSLQAWLMDQHQIEVPIFCGPPTAPRLIRTSSQAYNHISEIEKLASALREHFG